MKTTRLCKTLALLGASILITSPGLQAQEKKASDEEASDKIIELPRFEVKATKEETYNPGEAASVGRIVGKILDTPTTVNVITPAMLKDISPLVVYDAASYFPGVSNNRGTGTGGALSERMTFRGIESFGRMVDSFSGVLQPYGFSMLNNFPSAFVDRVEMVMGPNTILNPTGSPGGTINMITKSPKFVRENNVSFALGEYFANRLSVDSTGPLGDGKRMAYRAVASYQDAKTFLPGRYRVMAWLTAFTYRLSSSSELEIKYYGDKQRGTGTVALAGTNGQIVSSPDTVRGAYLSNTPQPGFQYQGWNGDAKWSFRDTDDSTLQAKITAQLSDRISARFAAQSYHGNLLDIRGFPSVPITTVVDQDTGQVTSVTPIDITNIREVAQIGQIDDATLIQFQNDYAGNFNLGDVPLQVVGGLSYVGGTYDSPAAQTFNVPPADLRVSYDAPMPARSAFTSFNGHNKGDATIFQAWGYMRANFLKNRLIVTGGAGRVIASYALSSLPTADFGAGIVGNPATPITVRTFSDTKNPAQPSVKPQKDTYMASILGKLTPNTSIYYSFSTNAGLAQQNPLWLAGKQHEFGLKWNTFNDRLTISATHFDITQSNVGFFNPLFTLGQSSVQTIFTDLTSKGQELSVVGDVTNNVSVILSFTNQKTRDFVGRRLRNIPDRLATALVKYRFDTLNTSVFKNTGVFVGVIHQGDVSGELATGFTSKGVPIQPGFYLRPWTVVNAGANTTVGRVDYNLNVGNVLDSKFWWQAQGRQSVSPYPGLSVVLSGTVHF
jgi:iron complex outermembrane receptor protein